MAQVHAQEAQLIEINSNQKLYTGNVEGVGSIQFFLRTENSSPNIGYISTLGGWYSMRDSHVKTKLAGILVGDIILLFTADNTATLESIKDFEYSNKGEFRRFDTEHRDLIELSEDFEGIDQRFILQMDPGQGLIGIWNNGFEEKSISIRDQRFKIVESDKYLKLKNGSYFNLNNIYDLARIEYDIEAIANNGQNILLKYEYQSNLNYNGRCGGGTETGKIALSFDEDYHLLDIRIAYLASCYQELYTNEIIQLSPKKFEYRLNGLTDNELPTYIIDYEKATIIKK